MMATTARLLASDMDGTMIPLDGDPVSGRSLVLLREALQRHPEIHLCYVTGRRHDLALEGVDREGLPPPRHLISDVGTVLSHRVDDRWERDPVYLEKVQSGFGGHTVDDVAATLEGIPMIQPQEDACQSEFKCSYYIDPGYPLSAARERCRLRLRRAGIPAQLVASADQLSDRGLLDVLPSGIAKDTALRFLARYLDLSRDQVLYAGDSGNDEQAFKAGYLTVLVGNTPPDVRKKIMEWGTAHHMEERIYCAQGNATAGVLEGARHFEFLPDSSA